LLALLPYVASYVATPSANRSHRVFVNRSSADLKRPNRSSALAGALLQHALLESAVANRSRDANTTGACSDRACGRRCAVVTKKSGRFGVHCADDPTCNATAACAASRDRDARREAARARAFNATTSCRYEAGKTKPRRALEAKSACCCWPRVFVLGAHKSGTTALFAFLVKHRTQMVSPGPKENNKICDVAASRPDAIRSYERGVGNNLALRVADRGNVENLPMYTVEATPSNTFCRGPEGLSARVGLVEARYRPRIIFVHRDPVDRAWSDFRYFSTFNDLNGAHACYPTVALFAASVVNQTAALEACAPYYNGTADLSKAAAAACDAELKHQLQAKLPYLPCTHLVRLVPGFSAYFERRWRAAVPDDRFLSVSMDDMLGDAQFGKRVWSFLGLELSYAPRFARGPPLGPVPRKDPKVGGGNKNLTFDFEGVAMPADSKRKLARFYATFDTSVFDAVI